MMKNCTFAVPKAYFLLLRIMICYIRRDTALNVGVLV